MMHMTKPFFFVISGAIFFVGAVLHGFRALYGFDMVYSGWVIPLWVSWLATIVAFVMAFQAIKNVR